MTRYNTILTPTDFSALAETGVKAGLDILNRFEAKRLHVLHVIQASRYDLVVPQTYSADAIEQIYARSNAHAHESLAKLALSAEHGEVTRDVRLGGMPAREIADMAASIHADLIVIASHGYGAFRRAFLGSVAGTLIRIAPCPVLVVGEERPGGRVFENILAAIDLSPVSQEVARHAVAMAPEGQGKIHAVSLFEHPVVSYGEETLLPKYITRHELKTLRTAREEKVQALFDEVPHAGVEVTVEAMSRAPQALVILETAAFLNSDLVVIGTSGHNAWHRMIIGSTATRVIAEAPCPVLVIPNTPADALGPEAKAATDVAP